MSAGHAHHAPPSRARDNRRRLTWVLGLTATFLVAEVVGGLLTGSLALLADAGHMLTDVGGVAFALLGMKFADRPATPQRTYGFHRAEILAALLNALVLIGLSLYICVEAYQRFRAPPEVASLPMLGVAVLGLGVNVAGVFLLRAGASDSLNMKGAYFEVLSDGLASLGVILAALLMWLKGWYWADPVISAAIGLFILPRTWRLLREVVGILLEGTPTDVNLAALREGLLGVPGFVGVHDLHVWALTSGHNAMSVHVVRAAGVEADALLSAVRARVTQGFKVAHLTVQVEPQGFVEGEMHL